MRMTKSNVNYLSFRFIDVPPSCRFDARTTRRVGENERRTKAKQEKSTPYRLLTRQQVREYSFCYFYKRKIFPYEAPLSRKLNTFNPELATYKRATNFQIYFSRKQSV